MAANCSAAEQSFIEKDLCTMFSPELLWKTAVDYSFLIHPKKENLPSPSVSSTI